MSTSGYADDPTRPTVGQGDAAARETAALIHHLGVQYRATAAYRTLFRMGFAAVPAAREGLRHTNADVRYHCLRLLDHFLVPEALSELLGMLRDPDARVRRSALHALACDRCKKGACRPGEAEVLPEALRLLCEDDSGHVRTMAIEVVGQYVHTNPLAERALLEASTHDPTPTVRKKAGWYAPGGPIHRRTAPRPARKARRRREQRGDGVASSCPLSTGWSTACSASPASRAKRKDQVEVSRTSAADR
jgi:HEAT repeats